MRYVELRGARVPALGFGTWELRGQTCIDMVRHALELGYRHVDTAQMYENETEVGRALREVGLDRGELFLTSKVWLDRLRHDELKRAAEERLRRLETDYLDLLLIHWPSDEVPLAESLQALAELKAEGKARHVGVSNFTTALLREAVDEHGAELLCNQVEYHPYLSQRPLLQALRDRGMMLTAYCPVAKGAVMGDPVLAAIAERHGKTPAQVALRWLVAQDAVAAIPRTSNRDRCRENLEIFDFELSAAERAEIDRLACGRRLVDPTWAPAWDPGP